MEEKKEVPKQLKFPLDRKEKYLAMLAPSFVVDFSYPEIIFQLKELGFDKVTELTFGAKMINRDYHNILEKEKGQRSLLISSVCPGIVETIRANFPEYAKQLIKVDSPMAAMSKICRKSYPNHRIVFFAPCNFKKIEAGKAKNIDYVMDFRELKALLEKMRINGKNKKGKFDKFYNDSTKIGMGEVKVIDGMAEVSEFLKNPDKEIRFLDVTFCRGGCVGGPNINSTLPIAERKNKVLKYIKVADKEKIPENRKGLVKKAEGISFKTEYWKS